MSAKTYTAMNGAVPGAAAAVAIATNTAIRTMMQLQMGAQVAGRIVEWWTEFDGSAAATPIKVEILSHTTAPQTTLTTYGAADVPGANDPNAGTTAITLASNASGFSSQTTEVTPTGTVRNLSTHFVPPTSGIYIQYPLGREPEIVKAGYVRGRVTSGTNVNCLQGITWEE
ncbi:MAG: hypothetical protein L3K06_04230 [Thermoplasmata archaeon]|nr:hypothetical protein [Thermoplasmata archaeon]